MNKMSENIWMIFVYIIGGITAFTIIYAVVDGGIPIEALVIMYTILFAFSVITFFLKYLVKKIFFSNKYKKDIVCFENNLVWIFNKKTQNLELIHEYLTSNFKFPFITVKKNVDFLWLRSDIRLIDYKTIKIHVMFRNKKYDVSDFLPNPKILELQVFFQSNKSLASLYSFQISNEISNQNLLHTYASEFKFSDFDGLIYYLRFGSSEALRNNIKISDIDKKLNYHILKTINSANNE